MEKENKEILLRFLDRNKTIKRYFIAFFLLSILGFSLSVIIENRKYPDSIDLKEVSGENEYVECTVAAITECIADYSNGGDAIDEYYLATDGSCVYILNLSRAQYNLLCNELQDESGEDAVIYGLSTNIESDLKQIAIDIYNKVYENNEITLEDFNDYFIPYVINAKYNPNSSAIILKDFGYLFGFLTIIFGIYCIFIIVKSRKNIGKFSREYSLDDLITQLSSSSKIEYKKSKIIFLKDYIISYSSVIYIINYKDIVWIYPYDFRVYGIVTTKKIVIVTKDKKQYFIGNTSAFGKINKEQYEKCINEIIKRRPNVLVGYTPENIVAMNKENIDNTISKIVSQG